MKTLPSDMVQFCRSNLRGIALVAFAGTCAVSASACGGRAEVVVHDGNRSTGGTGAGGTGGASDGGSDAYINLDGGAGDSSFGPDRGTCAWETREPQRAGVDIIFVIDNFG